MQGMDMYLSKLRKLHLLSKHKCHNHSAHKQEMSTFTTVAPIWTWNWKQMHD